MPVWIKRPQKPKLGMFVETHTLIPAFSPRGEGESFAASLENRSLLLEPSASRHQRPDTFASLSVGRGPGRGIHERRSGNGSYTSESFKKPRLDLSLSENFPSLVNNFSLRIRIAPSLLDEAHAFIQRCITVIQKMWRISKRTIIVRHQNKASSSKRSRDAFDCGQINSLDLWHQYKRTMPGESRDLGNTCPKSNDKSPRP
jgi:hypothetical protein